MSNKDKPIKDLIKEGKAVIVNMNDTDKIGTYYTPCPLECVTEGDGRIKLLSDLEKENKEGKQTEYGYMIPATLHGVTPSSCLEAVKESFQKSDGQVYHVGEVSPKEMEMYEAMLRHERPISSAVLDIIASDKRNDK